MAFSMEEFCEAEFEGARIEWEKGVDGLRSRIREMVADKEVREPVVRTAAAFRDAFEQMSWGGKESRFAAFISEAMEGIGGVRECGGFARTFRSELRSWDVEISEKLPYRSGDRQIPRAAMTRLVTKLWAVSLFAQAVKKPKA